MPKCLKCNALYGTDDDFCPQCGESLTKRDSGDDVESKILSKREERFKRKFAWLNAKPSKPKPKVVLWIFIVSSIYIVLMILSQYSEIIQGISGLLIIGVIIYIFYRRKKKNKESKK